MRWISLLAALILLGCSVGGPSGGEDEDEAVPEPIAVVETRLVAHGSVNEVLLTSAVVESEAHADLLPIATGIVIEVLRDEGDVVQSGDVLAVIDNATLDAGAERASAELGRVRRDYERIEALHGQGAVSERELLEARYALDAAQTSAREATRTHGQTRITAPFDGVVAARDVRVGEVASSARRAFQVVDLSRLRVVASLPEKDLARVEVGQQARLVSAYDDAVSSQGSVSRVAPVVDPRSGTFRVTLDLPADQGALRPGQYVSVELQVDRREGVVVVPRKALTYEDGLPFVYRVVPAPEEEEGDAEAKEQVPSFLRFGKEKEEEQAERPEWVAERVRVKVGLADTEFAEITDGVELQDEVITVGQSTLRDGGPVTTPTRQAEKRAQEAAAARDEETDGSEG
jgi:membrane fusion protein (multidrug efflux system)